MKLRALTAAWQDAVARCSTAFEAAKKTIRLELQTVGGYATTGPGKTGFCHSYELYDGMDTWSESVHRAGEPYGGTGRGARGRGAAGAVLGRGRNMKHPIKYVDEQPMVVIRPSLRKLARSLALQAVQVQKRDSARAQQLFQEIPLTVQRAGGHYTRVGYLSVDGKLVDKDGQEAGSIQEGDSFITEDGIEKLQPAGDA